jgi:hypothetical protein
MADYTITGTRYNSEVRTWNETDARRARKLAREIARDWGETLDDVYVELLGHVVYHLRRTETRWQPVTT